MPFSAYSISIQKDISVTAWAINGQLAFKNSNTVPFRFGDTEHGHFRIGWIMFQGDDRICEGRLDHFDPIPPGVTAPVRFSIDVSGLDDGEYRLYFSIVIEHQAWIASEREDDQFVMIRIPQRKSTQPRSVPKVDSDIVNNAISSGLFNPEWYKQTYHINCDDTYALFQDYHRKSRFSPVNPSLGFDTEYYNRTNIDVFHDGIGPLAHFIDHGRSEGRLWRPVNVRWRPKSNLLIEHPASPVRTDFAIAVHFHVFYLDVLPKFAELISAFSHRVDVFVNISNTDHIGYFAICVGVLVSGHAGRLPDVVL